jgi:hypothetical protein
LVERPPTTATRIEFEPSTVERIHSDQVAVGVHDSVAVTARPAPLGPASAVDRESTLPQGKPCSQCGFPYDVQSPYCPACGHAGQHRAPLAQARSGASESPLRWECKQCGSQVVVVASQRSYTCPFCESNMVVEQSADRAGRFNPDFVVGFRLAPDAAADTFRRWIRQNSWFRPGDLHQARITDRLRGVYLPFWAFSALAQSRWSAQIGEYWYRTERVTVTDKDGKQHTQVRTVRETEWWPLSGQHHRYYTGHLVPASHGLSVADAESIKPFHLAACQRYQSYFLAGWSCEEYSIDRDEALHVCRAEFANRERHAVAAFLPGDTSSGLEVQSELEIIDADLVLLPVYLLSYRYRGKSYRFLINGQTGAIMGNKPISYWRTGFAIVVATVVIIVITLLAKQVL